MLISIRNSDVSSFGEGLKENQSLTELYLGSKYKNKKQKNWFN